MKEKPALYVAAHKDGDTLWCVHVHGPDTIIAQPSKEVAEKNAAAWNADIKEMKRLNPTFADVMMNCVVAPYPYSAQSHADDLAEHGGSPEEIF